MTLNYLLQETLSAFLMSLRILVWAILAFTVYLFLHWLALKFHLVGFDKLCAPPFRHYWFESGVIWCETWWWHPFRISVPLLSGSLTALIVMAAAWLILPRTRKALISAAAFMVVLAAFTAFLFAVKNLMKDTTSNDCPLGWYYEDLGVRGCRRVLDPFDDLHFYYPGTVALLSLTLALRRGIPNVKLPLDNQQS